MFCWPLLVAVFVVGWGRGWVSRSRAKKSGAKNLDQRLTEGAAKRSAVAVVDLPDLGRPWTVRDVVDARRDRPQWLCAARAALAAARAEEERQRAARLEAVLTRRRTVGYPAVTEVAWAFARDFAKANLLNYLRDALGAAAADTEVWDCGYDVSTHARRADETNRERAKRGVSLSGRNEQWCREHGLYREPGTLGDLFDAPNGNTKATYVSGAGLDAETWADAWRDYWALESLAYAYVIAGLVLAGDVETLEVIAGVPAGDVEPDDRARRVDCVPADVMSLACRALYEWTEIECPVLEPEQVVDMDAPLSGLSRMLLSARRSWSRAERLAVVLAGLDAVDDEVDAPVAELVG